MVWFNGMDPFFMTTTAAVLLSLPTASASPTLGPLGEELPVKSGSSSSPAPEFYCCCYFIIISLSLACNKN